jgi:hypothetical protein
LPHYHIPRQAQRAEQAIPFVQAALNQIEERVRMYPENSNEYFFWAESDELAQAQGHAPREQET